MRACVRACVYARVCVVVSVQCGVGVVGWVRRSTGVAWCVCECVEYHTIYVVPTL